MKPYLRIRNQNYEHPLMRAAADGDLGKLSEQCELGADLNQIIEHGSIPMVAAIRGQHRARLNIIGWMLENGASVDRIDSESNSTLHYACYLGDAEAAKLLLDHGASWELDNTDHLAPLAAASASGNWSLAKLLINHGADINPGHGIPPLHATAMLGRDDPLGAETLISSGADVNFRGKLGRTALMGAAMKGNPMIAELLLKTGADINARDDFGNTALMEAARSGANAVLERFVTWQPDTGYRDKPGRTALLVAVSSRRADAETIRLLLAMGADPHVRNREGREAGDLASAAGRWRVAKALGYEPVLGRSSDAGALTATQVLSRIESDNEPVLVDIAELETRADSEWAKRQLQRRDKTQLRAAAAEVATPNEAAESAVGEAPPAATEEASHPPVAADPDWPEPGEIAAAAARTGVYAGGVPPFELVPENLPVPTPLQPSIQDRDEADREEPAAYSEAEVDTDEPSGPGVPDATAAHGTAAVARDPDVSTADLDSIATAESETLPAAESDGTTLADAAPVEAESAAPAEPESVATAEPESAPPLELDGPSTVEIDLEAPAETESVAAADTDRAAPAEPESAIADDVGRSGPAEPESVATAEPESAPPLELDGPSTVEIDLEAPAETESVAAAEPETPSPAEPDSATADDVDRSEPAEPESAPPLELDDASTVEIDLEAPAETESVAAAEPETLSPAEPDSASAADTDRAAPAEPESVAATEPESAMPAEPDGAGTVEIEVEAPAETESVAAAEPETLSAAEPDSATPAEPDGASTAEIEIEAPAETESVAAAEPEAPSPTEPDSAIADDVDRSEPAEPESVATAEPESAPPLELDDASTVEIDVESPAETESVAAAEPDTPSPAEPDSAIADDVGRSGPVEPESVAATEPDSAISVEPDAAESGAEPDRGEVSSEPAEEADGDAATLTLDAVVDLGPLDQEALDAERPGVFEPPPPVVPKKRQVGYDALLQAATNDDLDQMKMVLLSQQDMPEWWLAAAFLNAVARGRLAAPRWLLDNGLSANASSEGGKALLSCVVQQSPTPVQVISLLLDRKARAVPEGQHLLWISGVADHEHESDQGLGNELDELLAAQLPRLITAGATLAARDALGRSPLHWAVKHRGVKYVSALLAAGSDVNARDEGGNSVLMYALDEPRSCQMGILRALIKQGADPRLTNDEGVSPISRAMESGDDTVLKLLMLGGSARPERPARNDQRDSLVTAAAAGNLGRVKRLLARRPDVNERDAGGCTALLRAAGGGHAHILPPLIAAGADLNLAADNQTTPLGAAVLGNHVEVVRLLIERGVSSNQPQQYGITPLMLAAARWYPAMIRRLLRLGARVDQRDEAEGTALMAAAQNAIYSSDADKGKETLKTLLQAGADVGAVNDEGQTVLMLLLGVRARDTQSAKDTSLVPLVRLLIAGGVDLDAQDFSGWCALHAAAAHGFLEPARELLAAGASKRLRDINGLSPCDLAMDHAHDRMVDLFLAS